MIISGDTAPLIARRYQALALELEAAALRARELAKQCSPANADALELVADGGAQLVGILGAATQSAAHAVCTAESCSEHDQLVALPALPPEAEDESLEIQLTDWLNTKVPGWTDLPLPANLDPVISEVNEAAEWLYQRGFDVRDALNAAATLKNIRAALRLLESVIRPAVEDDADPSHASVIRALELARTRMLLRISQRDGTS